MQKMRVALLFGGSFAESKISEMSAQSVYKALKELGHDVIEINFSINLASKLLEVKPDVVFNAMHGTFGEDGNIQGLLEVLRIPYTHSGTLASAIAMDKAMTKNITKLFDIQTPFWKIFTTKELFRLLDSKTIPMAFPYVIKPAQQGSAVGVYIIEDKNSTLPKKEEWVFGDKILIEEYIKGPELSVPVFQDDALGVVELRPKNQFYDYTAKYTKGFTEHIYPAQINDSIANLAKQNALDMHKALGCRTLSRSDFKYDAIQDELYFLEINTHPGFTELSLLPEVAEYQGITFKMLIERLLKDAKCEI
ncbi:MAG: D-alanine--D-alanine ligase [Proteobacteria bacterium]|nr:D-alanine--D-alanine ligase [Pseudomonadota bacterium]